MSTIDELLLTARQNAAQQAAAGIAAPPSRHVAIVTCMDARVDPSPCSVCGRGRPM